MEELKYITSKESQDGENITLDEIKKIDKQKLAESLSNLDPALKNALLAGLKNLIQNHIKELQNASTNPQNKEAIVYALQIFWNLSGFSMKVDGVYTPELDNPEFKKIFLETKTQKSNISEKLWLPMEKLKDAKNLWEFLNTTLETLLKKYAQKLNSPEWIPLKTSEIYKELVLLLQEIDKNLPAWNIYKGNVKVIIDNFLTPKENGEKLIQTVIEKILNPNEKELNKNDIDGLKITLKGWLGTLIDIAKTQNEAKLKSYINEFKNIPKIKEYIDKVPEFDKIFDMIVSLVKTLDKNQLFTALDSFFEKNTDNLLKLSNKKPWELIDAKVKLEIVNGAWKIVDGLITKERVDLSLNKLSEFDFLKKNPLMSQILDIVNNGKLTSNDKLALFKELSNLVLNTTSPDASKAIQSENIKRSLNSIIELVSKFNKEWKVDEQKVVKLVKEFMNGWEETSMIEKIKKLKNIKELWSFLGDNFQTLYSFAVGKITWGDGIEEAIKDFVRNYRLSENISQASWNLIDRLEKAFNLNTADMILSMRKTLLESNTKETPTLWKNAKTDESKQAAYDIGSVIVDRVGKRWLELLKAKLASPNDAVKKLTKEDIINSIFSGIGDIFKDEKLKTSVFENAKKMGAKIDNKELFIQNLVSNFLNNPEFKAIINNVSTLVLSRLSNTSNVAGELDAIKNDVNKLVADFSRNYSKEWVNGAVRTFQETKLLDEGTKTQILSTSVSIVYDYVKEPKNIQLLLQAFPELKTKLPPGITPEKTITILSNLLKAIPKEVVGKIITDELKSGFDVNEFKKWENLVNILSKILQSPEVNREALLQTIIDAELGKIPKNNSEKTKWSPLSKEMVLSGIDSLYELLQTADHQKIQELVQSLWLDNLFAAGLQTTLKNIPKEALKSALASNMNLLNGESDMNAWLKFASELYEKIPAWNRLNVIDDLVSNISAGKGESGNMLKVTPQNAKSITNLLYATLETSDNNKILTIISKVSPTLHDIMKQPSLLGNNTFENANALLQSIPKEKFQNFLSTKNDAINSLMQSGNKNEAVALVFGLLWEANPDQLKAQLSKDKNLSKNESSALDMAWSVQKSIEKHKAKMAKIVEVWEKLEKHFNSWEKDISKSGLTQSEIKDFSEDVFDLISDTLNFELNTLKEKNNLSSIDEARVLLAEKFDLPKSDGNSKIDMSKISMMDFVMNNFWFALKWGMAVPFKGLDYTIKNAGIDYFLSQNRKWDFSRIVTGYFA